MGKGEAGDSAPENSQPDVAASSDAASSEIPAKKLARQLDFTGFGRMSTSVVLPDNPHPQSQTQLQSRSQFPLVAVLQSQAQLPPQPQSQPRMVVIPVSSSPRVAKPDSPKSRARSNIEAKDCTPKKAKQCNCKHSRCLKLYCECFASGIYCDGCNCINCYNNVENEAARREAVELTLERNPNAFRPKIANSPHGTRDNREEAGEVLILAKHNKGCHCKKSGCLKKYCECFQANILCSENCKCMDCKNFEGSEERQALFHGDHGNNIVYIQQAANAAITGAIGSSGYASPPVSKKRKGQELLFGHAPKDPAIHRLAQLQQLCYFSTSGFGFSDKPQPKYGFDYTLNEYVSSLESLVKELDIDKISLVVQGYFAPVVVKYAQKNQEKIKNLILINPPLTQKHADLPSTLSIFSNFLLGEIFSQDPLRASDKALTSCGPYKMKEDDAMVYRRPYLTSGSSGFALNAISRAMKNELKTYVNEMRSTLMDENWKVCTYVCWGQRDRWLSYDGVEDFCNGSNIKLFEIPMAGHHAQEDCGEELGKTINGILGRK